MAMKTKTKAKTKTGKLHTLKGKTKKKVAA